MYVIEQFTKGKKGYPDQCEDLFIINSNFVAVIDGATNVSGGLYDGKTPGRIAAETIKNSIESLPAEATPSKLLKEINQAMRAMHENYQIKEIIEKDVWKAPTASLAIYSRHHQEIWQIGDCQFMLDGVLYQNEKEIDRITGEARSLFLESEIKQGKTIEELLENDTGWKFILPLIKQQYYLQNDSSNQYGFEVINGFPVDEARIKITPVPKKTKELVVASDGYPFLKPTLEESEASLLQLMKEDPLCFRRYKSAKGLIKGNLSFDDRTYVRIRLEN